MSKIDREKAIEWATDAGMINFDGANWQCVTDQIQQIIMRAQNEAFEEAAKKADAYIGCDGLAERIRALIQENPKPT